MHHYIEDVTVDEGYNLCHFATNIEAMQVARLIDYSKNNLVVTGLAGTGKSTLMKSISRSSKKNIHILSSKHDPYHATVFSFFDFYMSPYWFPRPDVIDALKYLPNAEKLIRDIEVLVLDDVFGLHIENLVWIEKSLQKIRQNYKPFGGVQMIFCGDLNDKGLSKSHRMPDISGDFFFNAFSYQKLQPIYIELKRNYVFTDSDHRLMLNSIRAGTFNSVDKINSRVHCGHNLPALRVYDNVLEFQPRYVDPESALQATRRQILSQPVFKNLSRYDANINLAEGDTVVLKHDLPSHSFPNRSIGMVEAILDDFIAVRLSDITVIKVVREKYNMVVKTYQEGKFKQQEMSFSQFPITTGSRVRMSDIYRVEVLGMNGCILVEKDALSQQGQLYNILSLGQTINNFGFEIAIEQKDWLLNREAQDFLKRANEPHNKRKLEEALRKVK